MVLRKPMTKMEIALFRQKVIREYKIKHEPKKKKPPFISLLTILRSMIPLNIAIGLIASALFVYLAGWEQFIKTSLQAIIWIALIGTVLAALVGKQN